MSSAASPRTVIFSGVRWDFTWQRHHSLAAAAARHGSVLFVEPMPRRVAQVLSYLKRSSRTDNIVRIAQPVPPGVEVISFARYARESIEAVLRLRRRPRRWVRSDRPDRALCYVPSLLLLGALKLLAPGTVIYDHVVDWGAAPADWYPPRFHRWVERYLGTSRRVRAVITTDSAVLRDRWHALGVTCSIVLPAADDVFLNANWSASSSDRIIGYFGGLRPSEISIPLLLRYVSSGWNVHVVGPMDEPSRVRLTRGGVICHHPVPNGDLVPIIDDWGAILLPYSASPRLSTLVPAKLFNAVATRRPVHIHGLSLPDELLGACDVVTSAVGGQVVRYTARDVPSWHDRWNEVMVAATRAR